MQNLPVNYDAQRTASDYGAKAQLTLHARLLGLISSADDVAVKLNRLRDRAMNEGRDALPPSPGPKPVIMGFDAALRDLERVIQSLSESAQALDILA